MAFSFFNCCKGEKTFPIQLVDLKTALHQYEGLKTLLSEIQLNHPAQATIINAHQPIKEIEIKFIDLSPNASKEIEFFFKDIAESLRLARILAKKSDGLIKATIFDYGVKFSLSEKLLVLNPSPAQHKKRDTEITPLLS